MGTKQQHPIENDSPERQRELRDMEQNVPEPGKPIEKKPGNRNTAPPAGPRSPEVENSPSPYDQAQPGTPENRIIHQGEPEKPGPTAPKDENGDRMAGSGSQPGEVAVGLGDGLEGAPVEDFDIDAAQPADAAAMKERGTSDEQHDNEVQPSRKADAEVGLGEGMEGAPVEEYEEEIEVGEEREQRSAS